MSGTFPNGSRAARRSAVGDAFRHQQRDTYGQPATDSQKLRQFGRLYDERVRQTGAPMLFTASPTSFEEDSAAREPRSEAVWPSVVLGLVVFVALLAVAIGLAVVLTTPR